MSLTQLDFGSFYQTPKPELKEFNVGRTYCADYRPRGFASKLLHRNTFRYPKYDSSGEAQRELEAQGVDSEIIKLKFQTKDGKERSIKILYNSGKTGIMDLYAHGRDSNLVYLTKHAKHSNDKGNGFCLVSYRGNDGNPGVASQKANADAVDAAASFLMQSKGFLSEDINMIGSSMGSESIVQMLAKRAEKNLRSLFGKIKLIAPYSSLRDMAHKNIYETLKPYFPSNKLCGYARNYLMNCYKDHIFMLEDNITKIKGMASKLTIYASEKDDLVPYQWSRKLLKKARKALEIPIEFIRDTVKDHSAIAASVI